MKCQWGNWESIEKKLYTYTYWNKNPGRRYVLYFCYSCMAFIKIKIEFTIEIRWLSLDTCSKYWVYAIIIFNPRFFPNKWVSKVEMDWILFFLSKLMYIHCWRIFGWFWLFTYHAFSTIYTCKSISPPQVEKHDFQLTFTNVTSTEALTTKMYM